MDAQTDYPLTLVRGQVNIDVHAVDRQQQPPVVYACECKHWVTAVPQTVVHSFRQVVTDGGVNVGLLISRNGFQSGAHQAAAQSNVRLVTWEEFNGLFAARWIRAYFLLTLRSMNDPLVDYTEEMNSRIANHPMPFNLAKQQQFAALRQRHGKLSSFCLALCMSRRPLVLPLNNDAIARNAGLPADVLNEPVLRLLLGRLRIHIDAALLEFDTFFGGRV